MRFGLLIIAALILSAEISRGQSHVIDSLKKVVAEGRKDSVEAVTDLKLGNEYARTNMTEATRYVLTSISLARKLRLYSTLSAGYSTAATEYVQVKKTDSAIFYIDLLKKLADDTHIIDVTSNYNFAQGLFYRKQGNYKAAIPYMKEALRLFKIQKDKVGVAGQYLNIGNNYSDMGDYRNSMTYRIEALKLFEELGNKRGISFCYGSIGQDFIKLNQFAEALPYVQHSLALKTELNDKRGLANSYQSLALIQEAQHHPDKAFNSYTVALGIIKDIKLPIEEAKIDLELGKYYANEKDIDNARKYLDYSATLFKQLGDTAYVSVVNAETANLQKTIDRRQTTEKVFFNTLKTAVKMGDENTELNNYKFLSDFYVQNKQYDKALSYFAKYHNKEQSVQNRDLQLQVKQLEQQYNIEKREKEISLLKKDQQLYKANLQNQKLFRYGAVILVVMLLAIGLLAMARYRSAQKAKRLIEMEKMRNSIARNLHDDVGSILSSINILSKVALKQANGSPDISYNLERIKNSSYAIMEGMSDIVWAINPDNDSFEKTVLKMKEFAVSILEPAGIDFEFKRDEAIRDLNFGIDERKNLYLIFKEAVNNMAKYSGATQVNIELKKSANRFLMNLADNGKGFDAETRYQGNGLKNMRSRAAEMNAIFNITSAPAAGTNISLALPVTQ